MIDRKPGSVCINKSMRSYRFLVSRSPIVISDIKERGNKNAWLHFSSVGWIAVSGFGLLVNGILSAVPFRVLSFGLEFGELAAVRNRRVEFPDQKQGETNSHDPDDHT